MVDVRGEPHQRFYRVRWEGCKENDDTWRNWRDFEDGGIDAIDAFWETQVLERDKPERLDPWRNSLQELLQGPDSLRNFIQVRKEL